MHLQKIPVRPSRKEREKERRRAEILEAAERVFARAGFNSATMNDIAREAEFGVGTLYSFFPSKEELSMAFVEAHSGEMVRLAGEAASSVSDPRVKISAVIDALLNFFQSHHDLFQRYIYECPALGVYQGNSLTAGVFTIYKELLKTLEGIVRKGVEKKVFRRVDPFDSALALLGLIMEFVFYWAHVEPDRDLAAKRDTIADLYLKGVAL